jgi:hypothetical protein
MNSNLHLEDEVYRIVGKEVAKQEFHPGPMARAVAESQGNKDLVHGLYIRFRVQELIRAMEREAALARSGSGTLVCPNCSHEGKPVRTPRGNFAVFLFLLCAFVVPGLLYALACNGYRGVCANCRRTLIEWM